MEPRGWTRCETNADSGSEGPWEELALVELNQQGGLARTTVSNQDCPQRGRDETSCITAASFVKYACDIKQVYNGRLFISRQISDFISADISEGYNRISCPVKFLI